MNAPDVEELRSYFPIDAVIRDGKPQIEWLQMPNVVFAEPFFHQTVERFRKSNSVFTDLDTLLQLTKVGPSLPPAGFIFHTSRCGSTLVANACRALHSTRVIAEAPVIDKLVSRLFTDAEPGSTNELIYLSLVRAAVQSFARGVSDPPADPLERYVVKFACASILQITTLRRIWRDVPFLILFRDPIEITVSNLRLRPEWMNVNSNPGAAAAIVGVDVDQLRTMTDEEFCARALGRYYAAAESVAGGPGTRLVNYDQLSLSTLEGIMEFFGPSPSPEEIVAIDRSLLSHSKDPTRSFYPDGVDKKAAASRDVIEAVEKWAFRDYESLSRLTHANNFKLT